MSECCLSARHNDGHDADCKEAFKLLEEPLSPCKHGREPEKCHACIDSVVSAVSGKQCHGCGIPLRGGGLSPCTFCREWCLTCVDCSSSYEKGSCQLTITRCAEYERQMVERGRPVIALASRHPNPPMSLHRHNLVISWLRIGEGYLAAAAAIRSRSK